MSARPDQAITWRRTLSNITTHFWFKCFGVTGFVFVFFSAYIYLLKYPAYPVTTIPATVIDRVIGFEPFMLPFYISLWFYLSLPSMLMTTRKDIVQHGVWFASLCLTGLFIFYFWPTRIAHADIDWSVHQGMSLLKGIDDAGNACPSLHVATAMFAWFILDRELLALSLPTHMRILSAVWCACIVYSTMAIKQHMVIDVIAGAFLAGIFMLAFSRIHRLNSHDSRDTY